MICKLTEIALFINRIRLTLRPKMKEKKLKLIKAFLQKTNIIYTLKKILFINSL